ncbi:hypothetical protein TRFO_25376 [Tritrichomonas foetus]|uniref:Uncharacterized protein n=1 Tax=Tritrichomonas foetus TaxID=1144522 RepID=A0A1J4K6G9_9EUKA|nr:hypothetical protein TRFO_25376 [Tritrichomonas foetus]|eukprot:OHT06562.1 hypothetical protein TRFO_25376 [Tritrichomonas foetus]
MSVTLADFESLQNQLLQMKTENYSLREQIESAKKRSSLTPQQISENIKKENVQLRVRINQASKETEQLTEQLKLVKISQFLQLQNLYEATTIPDINTMPEKLKPLASDVFKLMDNVKQQIVRRAFLDTQVNELGKKTKSLGRTGETLQSQIDSMRLKQKSELASVDEAREKMQKLEAETAKLREDIQAATVPKANMSNPEDLKSIQRKIANLEEEHQNRKAKNQLTVAELTAKIEDYNRRLEDATSSKIVLEKKMHQKVWALQAEINKRRGIVVHSSKTQSRKDSAQLFLESKRLIGQIAEKQQDVWELEERVAFSRNTLVLMASDILKKMLGRCDGKKAEQMRSVAHSIVLELAMIDRQKKKLQAQLK